MQLHHLVKILYAVGNPGQAENRPRRIVRMAGHAHTDFLAYRNYRVQEVLEVLPQAVRGHSFILLQGRFQQCQPFRLPAGQGESLAAGRCPADDFQGTHVSQILFVKIQAVAAVLRDHPGQVRAQPVEYRHEVINDHLHAVPGQHADRGDVVGYVLIPPSQAGLDVLMNVHRLDDFNFKSGFVDFLFERSKLILRPVHAGRLFQQAHQAGHTGNLFDVLQRNRVRLASIPAECHFHCFISSNNTGARTFPGTRGIND